MKHFRFPILLVPTLVLLVAMFTLVSGVILAEEPPPSSEEARQPDAAKSGPSEPEATSTTGSNSAAGSGITVIQNYYLELPGFDLATLTPRERRRFLDRVNREMCTCGCPNDTLARCTVNDPNCPLVRGLVDKVLNEVRVGL